MVDKSEKFNWLVRVGYFSRAILYGVLGLLALTSVGAIGSGADGIFQAVEDFPGGTPLLWVMTVGLLAYGLFRLASPLFDIENNGSDAKGWAQRLGHGGSAIGHFALAYAAYGFASGNGSSGNGAQEAASGLLAMEFGGTVLGLRGVAFFAAAIFQAKKGFTGEFMQRIAPSAPSQTRTLGAIGYVARAVVFLVIGWSLVQAGFLSQGSDEVKTLGDAVGSLANEGIVFTLVAIGLLAFGLLSLILARYRIIPELDPDRRIPKFRA